MSYSTQPAQNYNPNQLARFFNQAFEGYFMPVNFSAEAMQAFLHRDNVSLEHSHILLSEGQPAGLALISLRPGVSRVAGMGITTNLRGKGAGRWLMELLIQESAKRGETSMKLEVIAQNEPAIRLYEHFGFKKIRRLLGWKLQAGSPAPDSRIPDIIIAEAAIAAVEQHGLPNLPWQVDAITLRRMNGLHGFRLGEAFLLTSDTATEHVVLRSLVVTPEARRTGQAAALLQGVFALHPGKTWHVPPIFPEELGGLFESLGFQQEEISQWQMERIT